MESRGLPRLWIFEPSLVKKASKITKNGPFGSLQGKKSPGRRFLEVLCVNRNKLPAAL
jgi:hypothetical protein